MRGKFIKMCLLYLIMALFLLSVLTQDGRAVNSMGAVSAASTNGPVFSSSFIQHWYCENFSRDRWRQELVMLKRMGIKEIIIQTTADNKKKYAVYPTKIRGFSHKNVDMLENVLSEADLLSIKVRIGTGFNDDWWSIRASDSLWLDKETKTNRAIVDEISKLYGNHPSFTGWYIPYEFCQFTAITNKQQSNLNNFFKSIINEINLKNSDRDVMVSPFYYGKDSKSVQYPIWYIMVKSILKGTGVDILALQDSVGAGYNTLEQLNDIFSYTKKAADSAGIKFYSVTETFVSNSSGNVPASQDTISKQLSIEKLYVQDFAAFSIDHYQNSNEASELNSYRKYYIYYLANSKKSFGEKVGQVFGGLGAD